MTNIISMFSYHFMIRSFIVGILITLCASLLGVSLVLRKNSMISDGLSHVAFGAFSIATILHITPIILAIPVTIIVSIFILRLNGNNKINGDGVIALLSSSSLAIGVMAISVTQGVNTDMNSYLFGSILSLSQQDMYISIGLSIIVLSLFIFSYHKIFALTFDMDFARSTGVNVELYNLIIAILCSITIVLGMRMMGSLLIASITIFPCLTSQQVFKTYKGVVVASSVIGVICFIIGLSLSYLYALPTGATIVIVNLICFIVFKIISMIKG